MKEEGALIELDPCMHCKKPSTGVYCMAYAPASMQMCDECAKRPLASTHNLVTKILRYKGVENAKKQHVDFYKKSINNVKERYPDKEIPEEMLIHISQVYFNGRYIDAEYFFDEISLETLDQIYSEESRKVNPYYKEVKKYLK